MCGDGRTHEYHCPSNSHPARVYWTVGLATVLWLVAYNLINPLAEWIAYTALQLGT